MKAIRGVAANIVFDDEQIRRMVTESTQAEIDGANADEGESQEQQWCV